MGKLAIRVISGLTLTVEVWLGSICGSTQSLSIIDGQNIGIQQGVKPEMVSAIDWLIRHFCVQPRVSLNHRLGDQQLWRDQSLIEGWLQSTGLLQSQAA